MGSTPTLLAKIRSFDMARYEAVLDIPPDASGGMGGIKEEDGGRALVCYSPGVVSENNDGCFFVRLHSWDDRDRDHRLFREFMGKRVRVTVETETDMRAIRSASAGDAAGRETAALDRLRAILVNAGVPEKDVITVTTRTDQYGATATATYWG